MKGWIFTQISLFSLDSQALYLIHLGIRYSMYSGKNLSQIMLRSTVYGEPGHLLLYYNING